MAMPRCGSARLSWKRISSASRARSSARRLRTAARSSIDCAIGFRCGKQANRRGWSSNSSRDNCRSSPENFQWLYALLIADKDAMASYRSTGKEDRAKAIAGVLLVHVALGAVILAGLNVSMVRRAVEQQLTTFDIKEPPPPPPEPPPPQRKSERAKEEEGAAGKKAEPSPIVAPKPKIILPVKPPVAVAPIPGTGSATAQAPRFRAPAQVRADRVMAEAAAGPAISAGSLPQGWFATSTAATIVNSRADGCHLDERWSRYSSMSGAFPCRAASHARQVIPASMGACVR